MTDSPGCLHVFRDSTRCLHCGVTEVAILRRDRGEGLRLLSELRAELGAASVELKRCAEARDAMALEAQQMLDRAEEAQTEVERLRTMLDKAVIDTAEDRKQLAATNDLLQRAWDEWGANTDGADDPVTQALARDIGAHIDAQAKAPTFAHPGAEQVFNDLQAQRKATPRSLLEPVGSVPPPGCHCPPDRCGAPIVMGRQMPCRRMGLPAAPSSYRCSGCGVPVPENGAHTCQPAAAARTDTSGLRCNELDVNEQDVFPGMPPAGWR
jgi:hypothetical protein